MEPAVSDRPCLKTHEIQTEVHHESNSSLNVCQGVEDEMDEETMDDKEEQSEESRAVRVGQKKTVTPTNGKNMNENCVAARASNPAHRGRKLTRAVEDDKDVKQFHARPAGNGISKDPGVEKSSYPNGVSSCGAVERTSS